MLSLVAFLVIGVVVGASGKIPDSMAWLPDRIITIGLVFLLMVMGAQLGADPEIAANISSLGQQAFLLAAAAILGSIAAAYAVERLMLWMRTRSQARQDREELVP